MESIYHLVRVKAKVAEVNKAFATKEGLQSWWTTKTTKVDSTHWRFHFPGDYSKLFKITEQDENHISWTCTEATHEWVGTKIDVELTQDGNEVVINFKHHNWKDASPLFGVCNFHWALYLKSLRDYLETGKGQPTQTV